MNIKTLLIYNDCENELQYTILEGDFSFLNGVCINSGVDLKKEKEACDLLYDKETGATLLLMSNDVSLVESKIWDKIAVVTFLP